MSQNTWTPAQISVNFMKLWESHLHSPSLSFHKGNNGGLEDPYRVALSQYWKPMDFRILSPADCYLNRRSIFVLSSWDCRRHGCFLPGMVRQQDACKISKEEKACHGVEWEQAGLLGRSRNTDHLKSWTPSGGRAFPWVVSEFWARFFFLFPNSLASLIHPHNM